MENCLFHLSKTHDYVFFSFHTLIWGVTLYILSGVVESKINSVIKSTTTQQTQPPQSKQPHHIKYDLKLVEKLFAFIMISVTIINILLRFVKGVPQWLLQPCHVLSALLIYVILSKRNSPDVFYLYFYNLWMPFVGVIAVPDDSWFYYWWEPIVFYVHHYAMLIIPFYYLFVNHRFHSHFKTSRSLIKDSLYNNLKLSTFKTRMRLFIQIFSMGMLYHTLILGYGGLLMDEDFNSMRCRFKGGEMFGIWWREALMIGGLVIGHCISILPDTITHLYYHIKNSKKQQQNDSSILSKLGNGLNYIQTIINSEIKKNN